MVAGTWLNYDGLMLQYGTQKAVPEVGGDYLVYGDVREIEAYLALVPTTFGVPTAYYPAVPAIVNSGTLIGTGSAGQAGIISLTTFVPLQTTTAQVATGGSFLITLPQIYLESVDIECLQPFTAGTGTTGTATALSVGLMSAVTSTTGSATVFTGVTPNSGVQLVSGALFTALTTGAHLQWWSNTNVPSGTLTGTGAWLGNFPIATNPATGTNNNAWISSWVNGTVSTSTASGGLAKLRARYFLYGVINQ